MLIDVDDAKVLAFHALHRGGEDTDSYDIDGPTKTVVFDAQVGTMEQPGNHYNRPLWVERQKPAE